MGAAQYNQCFLLLAKLGESHMPSFNLFVKKTSGDQFGVAEICSLITETEDSIGVVISMMMS